MLLSPALAGGQNVKVGYTPGHRSKQSGLGANFEKLTKELRQALCPFQRPNNLKGKEQAVIPRQLPKKKLLLLC
jgi:hypothetical protein